MGNYNSWGGKNNSWGNKNKKSNSEYGDNGRFDKFAKIVLGGVVLLVLANTGFGFIGDTISNISDVKDVVEVFDNTKNISSGSSNNSITKINNESKFNSVSYKKVDIDSNDIASILEYFSEDSVKDNMNTNNISVVFLEYSVFKNDKSYVKNIINKLSEYNGKLAFVSLNTNNNLSNFEMEEEFKRIGDIVSKIKEISTSSYTKMEVKGFTNIPSVGKLTIAVLIE